MSDSPKTVFETPWFSIRERSYGAEDDATYFEIARSNGVVCCVLTDEADLIMVRQYRPPLQRHTIEMPAGGVEVGESVEEAAAREIWEETGYECRAMTYITPLRLMINREDVVEHFLIGLGAHAVLDDAPEAQSEVVRMTREELRQTMLSDQYDQSVALTGLYVAEQRFGFRFFDDSAETIIAALQSGPKSGS